MSTQRAVGRSVNRVEGREKVTGAAVYTADQEMPDVAYAVLVQAEMPHGRVTVESLARGRPPRGRRAGSVLRADPPELPAAARPAARDVLRPSAGTAAPAVRSHRPARRSAHGRDRRGHPGERRVRGVALRARLRDGTGRPVARDVLKEPAAPDEKDGQIRHGSYQPDHFVKLDEEKLQDRRGAATNQTGTKVTAGTPRRSMRTIRSNCPPRSRTGTATSSPCTTAPGGSPVSAPHSPPISDCPRRTFRILAPLVGGAFGSKSFLWMHVALCAVAAREVRRPVKLVLTRNQMFSSTGPPAAHRAAPEPGGRRRRTIISTEQHTLTETSTVAHFCEPAGLSARFLYASPRLVTSHTVARINAPTPCFMRGPGEAPGLFALEVAMDELAYASRVRSRGTTAAQRP